MSQRQYTIDYEHDATGWWVASVRGVHGCHTQGRTIEQARERIHEALALVIGDAAAKSAVLQDNVRLSGVAWVRRFCWDHALTIVLMLYVVAIIAALIRGLN